MKTFSKRIKIDKFPLQSRILRRAWIFRQFWMQIVNFFRNKIISSVFEIFFFNSQENLNSAQWKLLKIRGCLTIRFCDRSFAIENLSLLTMRWSKGNENMFLYTRSTSWTIIFNNYFTYNEGWEFRNVCTNGWRNHCSGLIFERSTRFIY